MFILTTLNLCSSTKIPEEPEKQQPLKRIHSDDTLKKGSGSYSYEYWSKQPTQTIVGSLKPGNVDSLKVKPDGRIVDGNTRIKVLEERGYDINSLPRDYY